MAVRLNYGLTSGAIMRKRKFPAGLVVSLVMLLGIAAAYGVYNTTVANRTPEENARIAMQEAREAAEKSAPKSATSNTPSKDAIRAQVAQTAKGSGEGEGRPGGPPGRPGAPGAAPGSSILVPKQTPYKPVPNESATSSQWYQDKK